jgi:hypothetical protein
MNKKKQKKNYYHDGIKKKDQRKTSVEENLNLREQIKKAGGEMQNTSDSYLPIEIENEFMKHILAFENAPVKPIHEVINVKAEDFPEDSTLSDEQINDKLKMLLKYLNAHNIEVEYLGRVPNRKAYRELRESLFEDMEIIPGMGMHLDGCTGNCEDCWQLEWCENGKRRMEEWGK